MSSMLGRKGTVKEITHMFKTPGSGLTGPDKIRFGKLFVVDNIVGIDTELIVR
jgi:hypothetical protein